MSIRNFFYSDYWFSQPFTARGLTMWLLVGFFLLLFVGGLVAKILAQFQERKSKKIIFSRMGSLGITMGLLSLVWMFFRQERAAFLAWRFWMFLWVVGLAIWVYHLAKYALKRIPEIQAEEEKRATMEKYLPKKG